jgi:dTDP-4-dehydrorhamnose 3,5-epimerase
MKITNTHINGCFLITPTVHGDDRGYFLESFNQREFEIKTGLAVHFVQDNESLSGFGTVRGLHYQEGVHAQAKLVRVIHGTVRDVVVDLRPESSTYKQVVAMDLSQENKQQLFVPRGCAHGFSVLSETALFAYKCDNYYHKESERGIVYNDPTLAIDWGIADKAVLNLSAKDLVLPRLMNV